MNNLIYKFRNDIALNVATIYIVVSSLWILFSDKLLLIYPRHVILLSTAKGWIYTVVVGIFIYLQIKKRINKILQDEKKLKELDILKNDFLTTITHELITPLMPIKSQSQLLLNGDYGTLNNEQIKSVKMILKNEENLEILSRQVLDIAKIKSGKLFLNLEESDLKEIITESIENAIENAKEKKININILPIPNIPLLFIDKQKILQVLNNLISNAIKFTNEKGSINLEIKKQNNSVDIIISDTGIGIDKINFDKLFKPFSQVYSSLDKKYRGTGLGLYISKWIIESHNGKIWVESEGEGKGSSFIFSLPVIV